MKIQEFHSWEDLIPIREEWDRFAIETGSDMYLSFDYSRIWWEFHHFRRRLRVFVFRDEGRVVGILPMFIDPVWLGPIRVTAARFIGTDFTRGVVHPPVDPEFAAQVYEELFRILLHSKECDVISFGTITGVCPSTQAISEACEKSASDEIICEVQKVRLPLAIFPFPSTYDEYINSFKNKQRSRYRYYESRLNRDFEFQMETLGDPDEVVKEFDRFRDMHDSFWQARGMRGHFQGEEDRYRFYRAVLRNFAERGKLRFLKFTANGEAVGYQIGFHYGPWFHWKFPARVFGPDWDRYSIGTVTVLKMIELAIQGGANRMEGGPGRYGYKLELGAEEHPIHLVTAYPNRTMLRLRLGTFRLLAKVFALVYYRIWVGKVGPRLGLKWRPVWKIWFRSMV